MPFLLLAGINTAIADPTGKGASSGIGFALPIDTGGARMRGGGLVYFTGWLGPCALRHLHFGHSTCVATNLLLKQTSLNPPAVVPCVQCGAWWSRSSSMGEWCALCWASPLRRRRWGHGSGLETAATCMHALLHGHST